MWFLRGKAPFDPRTVLSRLLIVSGLALIGFWTLAQVHAEIGAASAIESFSVAPEERDVPQGENRRTVDTSLWSDARIAAFQEALGLQNDPPIAVLRVPRVAIEVPVFKGTDEVTLNRGVGWIAGTANPGARGNAGIAGHRDGFFRALKDVEAGDVLELDTSEGKVTYVVRSVTIVKPDRVDVLAPTDEASLTLVTCHPFYFVGSAPDRFIVHATKTEGRSSSHESNPTLLAHPETASRSGPLSSHEVD